MSIQKVIQESISGNPLEMKEALAEELRNRVAEALTAKMEETDLDEALDHEGLKKDFGDSDAKVHSVATAHRAQAEVIGHKSFKTDKGKVPVLKHYDRENFEHKEVPLRKGQKLVHDGDEHYHGYSDTHGHFRVHEDDMNKSHLRESMEELDELKKSTLASYVKKAAGVGHHNTLPNAMRDRATAAAIGDKEWYKQSGRNADNRSKGIQRAADRLAKEEVEQIDEISKSTLGSYATKALHRGDIANRMSKSDDDEMGKIANKRLSGVKKAVDKLADKTGKKALATSIKKDVDATKASGDAYTRKTGVDDQGKSYYKAARNIGKMREEVELDESEGRQIVDKLKSTGNHEEAGKMAFKHGLGRNYGPHFGMRSNKYSAETAYHKGYDKAELANRKKT